MKLLIVDDHDIFRQSLAMLLGAQDAITVLGHFSSITTLLDYSADETVDMVLMDYHIPNEDPVQALGNVQARWPSAAVVFLTGTQSAAVLKRVWDSGANGVLHKNESAEAIVGLLSNILAGERVVSESILKIIKNASFDLTPKEFDILAQLTLGKTPAEIAQMLCLSKRTVEKHKENIMRKTEVTNVAQLMELGHRLILPD